MVPFFLFQWNTDIGHFFDLENRTSYESENVMFLCIYTAKSFYVVISEQWLVQGQEVQ
jgi:hypothetical protein